MSAKAVLICLVLLADTNAVWGQGISSVGPLSNAQSTERAIAIAKDASGFYVLSDLALHRYDNSGREIWSRRVGGPRVIAATPGSGVYVGGIADNGLVFTRRYDANGNEMWTRQFGTEGPNVVSGVAADATGVYVSGMFQVNAPGVQSFLRKFDSDGAELWSRQTPGLAPMVAAGEGGAYVAGQVFSTSKNQGVVTRYSSDGSSLWTKTFDDDIYSGLLANATGVYTAGFHYVYANTPQVRVTFLKKYDSTGSELWARDIPSGPLFEYPGPPAMAIDEEGIYLASAVLGALPGQCPSGKWDQFVRYYDLAGNETWTVQFGSYEDDLSAGVAADSSGVYAIGNRSSGPVLARIEKKADPAAALKPEIRWGCVLNAASLIGGAVSAGEIVTILGARMGPQDSIPADFASLRRAPAVLANARVLFNGVAAPLLSVSAERITAIAPRALAGASTVDVQVEYQGVASRAMTIPVLDSHSGIFSLNGSGKGPAAVLNQDGTVNSASNPAEGGSIISIYATGGGPEDTPAGDGMLVGGSPSKLTLPAYVGINPLNDPFVDDGDIADVVFAGSVPGSIEGLVQINARLPTKFSEPGIRSVYLLIGRHPYSQGGYFASYPIQDDVTIAVR